MWQVYPLYGVQMGAAMLIIGELTAILALVESKEQTHNSADQEKQTDEVKFAGVFPQRLAMVRVQVQEEKEKNARDPACWSKNTVKISSSLAKKSWGTS